MQEVEVADAVYAQVGPVGGEAEEVGEALRPTEERSEEIKRGRGGMTFERC